MGLSLLPGQISQFITYLGLLQQWARKINLTSVIDAKRVIDRHFFDSMALWAIFPDAMTASAGRLLDVGSGAGFPGLPLKLLAPSYAVTLLEPRQKRAAFLQTVIAKLGCHDTSVMVGRLSELPREPHIPYDWIVIRGVGQFDTLLDESLPLQAATCRTVLYLSRTQSTTSLRRRTEFLVSDHDYRLPFSAAERKLTVLTRR